MKLLELFAGYGSQRMALERLGVKVEGTMSDNDKYADIVYKQINGDTPNLGDVRKIKSLDYYDMWTYSFPCQDLSFAGKQAGIKEGTRSGLLYEVERLLTDAVENGREPKYLLLENVKALVSKKFKPDFEKWLARLDSLGYNNYWQVLNAKDYGVPQNRERVFVLSVRKDIHKQFEFPRPFPLTRRLKDILEKNVDEKYYLSEDRVKGLCLSTLKEADKNNGFKFSPKNENDIASSVTAKAGGRKTDNYTLEPVAVASRGRYPDTSIAPVAGKATEQRLEVNYSGCSNTLTTVQKDNYILEPLAYDEQNQGVRKDNCIGTLTTDGSSPKHNNRVIEPTLARECTGVIQVGNFMASESWNNPQCGRVYSQDGVSPTLNTCGGGSHEPKIISGYRVRKLTPHECWRLMGVTDEEYKRVHDISNTQLYKLAGNSIVVDVLYYIFKQMIKEGMLNETISD